MTQTRIVSACPWGALDTIRLPSTWTRAPIPGRLTTDSGDSPAGDTDCDMRHSQGSAKVA